MFIQHVTLQKTNHLSSSIRDKSWSIHMLLWHLIYTHDRLLERGALQVSMKIPGEGAGVITVSQLVMSQGEQMLNSVIRQSRSTNKGLCCLISHCMSKILKKGKLIPLDFKSSSYNKEDKRCFILFTDSLSLDCCLSLQDIHTNNCATQTAVEIINIVWMHG